jgi:hypothetical protein
VEPGETLDLPQLRDRLGYLYGTGFFEQVGFRLERAEDSAGLVVEAKEKAWGPGYLRFGLALNEDLDGDNGYGFLVNYTHAALTRFRTEARVQLELGELQRLSFELYQPVDREARFFVAPSVEYLRRFGDSYGGSTNPVRFRDARLRLGSFGGVRFDYWAQLRVGLLHEGVDGRAQRQITDLPEFHSWRTAVALQLDIDSFDDPDFPREGTLLAAEWLGYPAGLGARHAATGAGRLSDRRAAARLRAADREGRGTVHGDRARHLLPEPRPRGWSPAGRASSRRLARGGQRVGFATRHPDRRRGARQQFDRRDANFSRASVSRIWPYRERGRFVVHLSGPQAVRWGRRAVTGSMRRARAEPRGAFGYRRSAL